MATQSDIEYKIRTLEAGEFQRLCDAYLYNKGYKNIYSLGTQQGTTKTTKGTPDTFFRLESGKYIFVEYTTTQKNLKNKITNDLQKCLDEEITKIPCSKIEKIIYCHTSSNLSPNDIDYFNSICNEKGVELYIIGLNELALSIRMDYPILAKDFLGLELDSGQILDINSFIKTYNSNKTSAHLDRKFLFREKESYTIKDFFKENDVVILTGKPGNGKTRLALEIASEYEKNNYKTFCLKNLNTNIETDLKSYINQPKKYFLVIDDANTFEQLKFIISFLSSLPNTFEIKILLTVRDYAFNDIKIAFANKFKVQYLSIQGFTSEEIIEFLKVNFGIRNHDFIEQIERISEGNLRLLYLTAQYSLNNSLKDLYNASQFYDTYYTEVLRTAKINLDVKIIKILFLIAFLRYIDKRKLDTYENILNSFEIPKSDFLTTIQNLHIQELIDIKNDIIISISEQSLNNYFIFLGLIKNKIIRFSDLLKFYYSDYKENIIETVNTLFSVFYSNEIYDYISDEINEAWDFFAEKDIYEDFLKKFHIFNQEKSLTYTKRKIDNLPETTWKPQKIDFENNRNFENDVVLSLLYGYRNLESKKQAIQLILKYIEKRPEKTAAAYGLFHKDYMFTKTSNLKNYEDENLALDSIIAKISVQNIAELFIRLSTDYLLTIHNITETTRREKSIILYTISVEFNEGLKELRRKIWNNIICLAKNNTYISEITELLKSYNHGWNNECKDEKNIYMFDLPYIKEILDSINDDYEIKKFEILKYYLKKLRHFGIDYANYFSNILISKKWKIFTLFSSDRYEISKDYKKTQQKQGKRIYTFLTNLSTTEQKEVVLFLSKVIMQTEKLSYNIQYSITSFLLYEEKIKKFSFDISKLLLQNLEDPYISFFIVKHLFKFLNSKTIFEEINSNNAKRKGACFASFFIEISETEIDEKYYIKFNNCISDINSQIDFFQNLNNFLCLKKFLKFNNAIYCDIFTTILELNNKNLNYSIDRLFDKNTHSPELLLEYFNTKPKLLKELYFIITENKSYADYEGEYFKKFVSSDISWIDFYLEKLIEKIKTEQYYYIEDTNVFHFCWELENYIEIFDKVFLFSLKEGDLFFYKFKNLFNSPSNDNRQLIWFKHTIETFSFDEKIMIALFDLISEKSESTRISCIKILIEKNKSISLFKDLQLEPNHCEGIGGSFVPCYERRKEFYKLLIPLFDDIDLLEHKEYITEKIKQYNHRIENEKINNEIDKHF